MRYFKESNPGASELIYGYVYDVWYYMVLFTIFKEGGGGDMDKG